MALNTYSRKEEPLATAANGDASAVPEPRSRVEKLLLAAANGENTGLPEPRTREEALLVAVCDAIAGGGGADGKSAYAYAVEGGYTGTEAEFAAKLAAEKFANPNALTFTGALTGSYDGSAPLSVEIPSGGGSSGGSTAEWQLLGTYTMLVSDKSLVIDLSQFGGITHFRIIGNFPKCSEDCGVTYFYLGTAFNHTNQPSQKQNVYAFNLLAECELVDGQLYGFIGTIDGWTAKSIASVAINTPRDSGKNTSFKIFYEKNVNDTTEDTIQIWGY